MSKSQKFRVVLYRHTYCDDCNDVEIFFARHNIVVSNRSIEDGETAEEAFGLAGRITVPIVHFPTIDTTVGFPQKEREMSSKERRELFKEQIHEILRRQQ